VAALIGADPAEVVFTSGGTESDNFAIRGVAEALERSGRKHLIASSIEHEAVINTLKALARRGWTTTLLPVDQTGVVSPDALRAAMTDETALVSIMHANNEIGTVQPIAELAKIAHERGALFHTDAVQSSGKIPIDVASLGVDLLSMSAHKFYGPKGVGALWIKRGLRMLPPVTGGKQERNRRAGTENVAGIVGMGAAANLARAKMADEGARLAPLRDRLEEGVLRAVPGTAINGERTKRVPNTTNISFDRVEAESLLIALDLEGIAVSTGSACSSGTLEPSHVLKAMGFPPHRTQNSIRFSLGAANTQADVDRTIAVLPAVVEKLRNLTRAPARV
jgi:cysteine desulfurase